MAFKWASASSQIMVDISAKSGNLHQMIPTLLISLRLSTQTSPFKNVNYVRDLGSISGDNISVIFVNKGEPPLSFADYGIMRFEREIRFYRINYSDSLSTACESYPCILPFHFGKVMHTAPAPKSSVAFALWLQNLRNHRFIKVLFAEDLRSLFESHNNLLFGVDIALPIKVPSSFPPIYLVSSSMLLKFGLQSHSGLYFFRSADRYFNEIQSSDKELPKSNLIDPISEDFRSKPYFGGFFLNTAEDSRHLISILSSLSVNHKLFNLAALDEEASKYFFSNGEFRDLQRPLFFVFNSSSISSSRWFVSNSSLFTEEYLSNFLGKIENDHEPFTLISSPIPAENESLTFKEVVADTFERKVMKEREAVLVAFTVYWCDHCKRFKPIIQDVSEKLRDAPINFYWMDLTKNELPSSAPKVNSFPTLYLWKFGEKKESPMQYRGNHTEESLIEFINKSVGCL